MNDIALLVILPLGNISKDCLMAFALELLDYLSVFRPMQIIAEERILKLIVANRNIYETKYKEYQKKLLEYTYYGNEIDVKDEFDKQIKDYYQMQAYDINISLRKLLQSIAYIHKCKFFYNKGIVFWGYDSQEKEIRREGKIILGQEVSFNNFCHKNILKHCSIAKLLSS